MLTSAFDGNAQNMISYIETSEEATMEVLTSIKNSIETSTPNKDKTVPSPPTHEHTRTLPSTSLPKHSGNCYFQAVNGVPGLLKCILGCNSTTSAGTLANRPDFPKNLQQNLFSTPPPAIPTTDELHEVSMGGGGVRVDAAVVGKGRGRGGRGRGSVGGRGHNTIEGFVANNRYQRHKKNKIAKNLASQASMDAQNLSIADLKNQLAQVQQQLNSQ